MYRRRSRWTERKSRRRNLKVANDLIIFIEGRAKKPGSQILSRHLAQLAFLAGRDFTEYPESILGDPDGSVRLDVFDVASMIRDAKRRSETSGFGENWFEKFTGLLSSPEELETKKIVIFAKKKNEKAFKVPKVIF